MEEKNRRNRIQYLDDARDQYLSDFQYNPLCPYDDVEDYIQNVKEVLSSGYDFDTESLILERLPYCANPRTILGLENMNSAASGISFATQNATKRMKPFWDTHQNSFPTLVQLSYSSWMDYMQKVQTNEGKRLVGNKTEEQRRKSFAKKLRKAVKYLHSKNYLPDSMLDLTMRTDAMFYTAIKQYSGILFAILDYGFPRLIVDKDIDDKCWMEALELTLCRHADGLEPLDFIRLDDKAMNEILDAVWTQVIIYGLLIHTIRILGNEDTYVSVSNINQNIDPVGDRVKELEMQIEEDTAAIKDAADMMDAMEGKIKSLQEKLDKTPDYSRQISALIHEHNLALKQKDEEIRSLLSRIERMETERMEVEQQMFQQDEAVNADKPWLNLDLPRENIIFLGGHPNMLKKLKEVYPEWTYIGTETEALHNLPKTCDYIFIWSGHISHGTWYHIDNAFLSRERYLFVQATNIQRLEEEMKYELWKRREMDARRDS